MITKAHITQRADDDAVVAKTVERDYVLAHIIAALGGLKEQTELVFKGGTALRLCHFQDYRYSADLDFSLLSGSKADGYATIRLALDTTGGSIEGLRLTDTIPPRIAYIGPLGRERTLKLDIADDELVLSTELQGLLPRWPDLPKDIKVLVYPLTEIAGEKLRCILQRLQCRDLYDLWLLFEEAQVDAVEAATIFTPKAEYRDIDPGSFATKYAQRLVKYRKLWTRELQVHIAGEVPHFAEVERQVARHLRKAGLL